MAGRTGKTYGVILADPPWRYDHSATYSRAIERQYPTMALGDICELPIAEQAAGAGCVLYLWATAPKLSEALDVMSAWGFAYRTSMVWVKIGRPGMGYWTRNQHDPLLIGVRGKPRTPLPGIRRRSVIFARRGRHSAKPPEVHEMIEEAYPAAAKLELFARRPRRGWDVWGSESVTPPFAMEMQG